MIERERRVAAITGREQKRRSGEARNQSSWQGQPAAIYCRISRARDEDQTGVDRQERLCREIAERLGLVVAPDCVFVDNNRSAWQRNRKRPGWDSMLETMRAGRFRHVIVYHPDRLMRQPKDLEELLTISEEFEITLHGQANRRDLSDPDDRFFLRIEVAHACRSSDDTSRRLKDASADRARDGVPHVTGKRRYGYTPNGLEIVPDEADVVRDIFSRYLEGGTPRSIARSMQDRGLRTAGGAQWQPSSVRRVLFSRHVTGIHMFRGEEIGEGSWPAIIDRGTWNEAQERMAYRASAYKNKPHRYYLLRGIVVCKRCGRHMGGAGTRDKQISYSCIGGAAIGDLRCNRRVDALRLEPFVVDAAIELLTNLDVSGSESSVVLSQVEQDAIAADQAELAELKDMWHAREITTREYREMRKVIEERIRDLQQKTIVRPTAEILGGIVGEHARERWDELAEDEEYERMNAVLRFLFAAVIIDEHRGAPGKFDYSRIEIEPNPL